jgi:hypothetical protein
MVVMKTPFIYVDLNGLRNGFLPWTTEIEFSRLKKIYPEFYDGMIIPLWAEGLNETTNKFDPMVFNGKFVFATDPSGKYGECWGFIIDQNAIQQLSQSDEFREFKLKDVLGEEYESYKLSYSLEWPEAV